MVDHIDPGKIPYVTCYDGSGGVWPSPFDAGGVRSVASGLKTMGTQISQAGSDAVSAWSQVGSYYSGPGDHTVRAAMTPVAPATTSIDANLGAVAVALVSFADAADPVVARLRVLQSQAFDLVADIDSFRPYTIPNWVTQIVAGKLTQVDAGISVDFWWQDPGLAGRNTDLVAQVEVQVERFRAAESDCANQIDRIDGGTHQGGGGQDVPDDAAGASQGAVAAIGLPWGLPTIVPETCVKGLAKFLGDLGLLGILLGWGRAPNRLEEPWRRGGNATSNQDGTTIPGPDPYPNGLGPPVEGAVNLPMPDAPAWTSDPDSTQWGTRKPTMGDLALWEAAQSAADELTFIWPHAAANLQHYLGNTGTEVKMDVDQMIKDIPGFDQGITATQQQIAGDAITAAKASGATGPVTFPIRTDWSPGYATPKDWYYASGAFNWDITGQITVIPPSTPGGQWTYQESVVVNFRDRYNWDSGKSTAIGPIVVTDDQMNQLHTSGLGQYYNMTGQSSIRESSGAG